MARRGRPPYPDVLTPRQWQVLELLRLGLTNEQIAARLGISVDGVKFHVSEILGKLGVTSRNEAARWERGRPAGLLAERVAEAYADAGLQRSDRDAPRGAWRAAGFARECGRAAA